MLGSRGCLRHESYRGLRQTVHALESPRRAVPTIGPPSRTRQLVETCSIITTTPNVLCADVYDHMPVILPEGDPPELQLSPIFTGQCADRANAKLDS